MSVARVGSLNDDGSCPGAGTITGLEADQRLFLRHDGTCDTGAYEFGGIPFGIFTDGFESGDLSAWSATVP